MPYRWTNLQFIRWCSVYPNDLMMVKKELHLHEQPVHTCIVRCRCGRPGSTGHPWSRHAWICRSKSIRKLIRWRRQRHDDSLLCPPRSFVGCSSASRFLSIWYLIINTLCIEIMLVYKNIVVLNIVRLTAATRYVCLIKSCYTLAYTYISLWN
jgi:hypothetical protein